MSNHSFPGCSKTTALREAAVPALTLAVCTGFMLLCYMSPVPGGAKSGSPSESIARYSWPYHTGTPTPESPSKALAALDWLRGDWLLASDIEEMKWSVQPSADGNYLVVFEQLAVTGGSEKFGVVRIIAFNPVSQIFDLFIFGSDGSFGTGRLEWLGGDPNEYGPPMSESWLLSTRILLPDGEAATMNELFEPVKDSFIWKSVSRTVAGEPLPDLGPLKARRIAPFPVETPVLNFSPPPILEADE